MITGLPFNAIATFLYASNCSSSVGMAVRSINRNSVRNRPTPSPSYCNTLSTSSGLPILATISTCTPSFVTESCPMYFSSSFLSFKNWLLFSSYSFSTEASGFTNTSPVLPSRTTLSPSFTASIRPFTATTAGISSALAKIALCEVFPPSSVTIPETFSGLMPAVMDGVRSFATSMLPFGSKDTSTDSRPINVRCIRTLISLISVARCCISSSPIDANISAYILHTFSIANSQFTLSFLTLFSISPVSMGSDNSIMCPCMISASFSPTREARSSAIFCVAAMVFSRAPLKRWISASASATSFLVITNSASSTITALPMPIPAEALVPLNICVSSLLIYGLLP